jgi:cytochrome c biogenesis protein CcmG/thiol:disulfide interchange protein DsbE
MRTWPRALHPLTLAGLVVGLCIGLNEPCIAFAGEVLLNRKAPEFIRMDLHGKRVDLNAYRGKVVLLNFWATWCAPCQVELPQFVSWKKEYGAGGLQVIGISMDDDPTVVRTLSKKMRLNYPIAMGDEELGELYGGILGLPVTYLIDKDGFIRAEFRGETDLRVIESQLKLLLN